MLKLVNASAKKIKNIFTNKVIATIDKIQTEATFVVDKNYHYKSYYR